MSREDDFAARMAGDTTLMALLTGGVYTSGQVGRLGITRETAPGAFDASGFLKNVALVRQRGLIPDGAVVDPIAQVTSAVQVIEIWLYSDQGSGYASIDAAIDRLYTLFQGHIFADTLETFWINTIDRERDQGALAGSNLARIGFAVYSIMGA